MRFSAFSAYHESSVVCAINQEVQFDDPPTDKKWKINTLMQEVKPMQTKKLDFE